MNYRHAGKNDGCRNMSLPGPRLLLIVFLWLLAIPVSAATPSNPLPVGDALFLSSQGLHRFDPASGRRLWSSLEGIETFAPVAWRDLVLVGSTQGLYAIDANSGEVSWHIERQRSVFTPSISIRAYSGSVHGELYAIDPGTGKILWRRQFPGWIYSPAINEAAAQLWTGGQPHRVYALSAADGSLLHEIETAQESVFSPLAIGADRVAFNLFDGSTVVIDAAHARVAGIVPGESQPTDLQRRGDTVYRGHRDGSLVAFGSRALEQRWRKLLTAQNLKIYPSQPGYLLLGDQDRDLVLLNLATIDKPCRLRNSGGWIAPIQSNARSVIYFQKQMQPRGITLVQTGANCK